MDNPVAVQEVHTGEDLEENMLENKTKQFVNNDLNFSIIQDSRSMGSSKRMMYGFQVLYFY